MQGEKFTLMQYNISAILGFIEAGDFVIPEIQRPFCMEESAGKGFDRFTL